MEKKLTKLEWYWILYDVGNSAFILLTSTILPSILITWRDFQEFPRWILLPTGAMRLPSRP